MAETSIQWCDHSINPIRFGGGHYCQKISPGCANCYASRLQPRFGNQEFKGAGGPLPMVVNEQAPRGGALWLDDSKLREVLRRQKPTKYFWCDMTDLFGAWVPDEWIAACFGIMAATPQHTHQILTKRPERMREWFTWAAKRGEDGLSVFPHDPLDWRIRQMVHVEARKCRVDLGADRHQNHGGPWPLPNVWLGVSVEDQQRADERIPHLLRTPAAVRFLSVEPLLGPVDLGDYLDGGRETGGPAGWQPGPNVDWVIVGGESGPVARPFDVAWARSLRDQCRAAGVPYFLKQMGSNGQDVMLGSDELQPLFLRDRKGGDMAEWSPDLRIRQMPEAR